MNKIIIIVVLLLFSLLSFAQNDKPKQEVDKFYSSVGGEYIFSFVNSSPEVETTNLRFSAWFHIQAHWHYDFAKHMGAFVGLGMRNIGYTTTPESNNIYLKGFTAYNHVTKEYELNNTNSNNDKLTTVKRRAYTVGIPIGLKIGNMARNRFVFFGGEIEFPFHYKNKGWVNNKKLEKNSWWFSNQVNPYLLSTFVGIQLPGGVNIKFKWYLNDFMNRNYSTTESYIDGAGVDQTVVVKPYENVKSQMFYISFGVNMFNAKRALKEIQTIDKSKKDSYNM